MLAPAGTPAEIVSRLNAEVVRAINQGGLAAQFRDMAFDVVAGTPDQFAQFIRDEIELHRKIVKASGMRPD